MRGGEQHEYLCLGKGPELEVCFGDGEMAGGDWRAVGVGRQAGNEVMGSQIV